MDKTKKKSTKEKSPEPVKKEEEQPPKEETKDNTSKSPEKTTKVTNIKPVKVTFTIPTNLVERIDFIFKTFDHEELIFKNGNAPERNGAPIEEIGKYFGTEYNTVPMALGGICYYISQNFQLDRENLDQAKVPEQDVDSVIKNGKGASEGISNLFIKMCKGINVNCELVTGLVKRKGFKHY